mmetsp:Transcript_18232/g.40560  ORF Transcript_18232/g.40560 Transcript_18232/m.40560 type:complete len:394 (+) Transcript_18232:284-1465(+)
MKTRTLVAMAGVTCVDSFNPGNPPRSNKRPAAAAADREVMLSSISPVTEPPDYRQHHVVGLRRRDILNALFIGGSVTLPGLGTIGRANAATSKKTSKTTSKKKVEADEEKKPSPITSITDPRLKNLATPIEGWQGTGLPNKSLSDAYQELVTYKDFISKDTQCEQLVLPLARWPDPILRKATKKVPLSIFEDRSKLDELKLLAKALRNTARRQNSAGLAARQCGIDASILFIERVEPSVQRRTSEGEGDVLEDNEGLFLVNPRVVERSPEDEMAYWKEDCSAFPRPYFTVPLYRDRIVTIEFEQLLSSLKSGDNKIDGKTAQMTLAGELGRRILHEMDHDRGVLIADYVESLDEMLSVDGNPFMMLIENCDGKHAQRRERAYSRPLEKATILT